MINTQIKDIKELKEGWFDGQGTSFRDQDLKLVTDFLAHLKPTSIIAIFPTPEGLIQIEWKYLERWDVSIDFEFQNQLIYFHVADLNSSFYFSKDYPLATKSLEDCAKDIKRVIDNKRIG